MGQGFAYGTRRFDVDVTPDGYRVLRFEDPHEAPEDWALVRLVAPTGFSAALACKDAEVAVTEHPAELA